MSFFGDFASGFGSALSKRPTGGQPGNLFGTPTESKIPSIEGDFNKPLDIPESTIPKSPFNPPESSIPSIEPSSKRVQEMGSNIMGVGKDLLAQQFPTAYKVAQALAKIESSGNYGAIGPTVKGKNAFGKYQIMEQNVPSWGKEATGKNVTLQDFKSNHDLQDRIAVYKINSLLQQGHSPQDVASIWLSGKPLQGNQRKDLATGISVPSYVANFNKAFTA